MVKKLGMLCVPLMCCLCCCCILAVTLAIVGIVYWYQQPVCVGGDLTVPLGNYVPLDSEDYFPGQTARYQDLGSQCHVKSGQDCSIEDMPVKERTFVFPGKGTSCIDETFPYGFQVWPGEPPRDKLLFYFQGGGACWDKATTSYSIPGMALPRGMCTQTIYEQSSSGVFDINNNDNDFKDYTIVHVNYCSGDAHAGTVTRDYRVDDTPNGGTCHNCKQNGYQNTLAVVEWTKANLQVQSLTELVLMACSAGSLGLGVWADNLLTQFKSTNPPAVIMDSYAGIFPAGTQTEQIKDYGMCSTGLLQAISGAVSTQCGPTSSGDDLSLQLIVEETIKKWPGVTFSSVNSKEDAGQIMFYEGIAATAYKSPYISKPEYYRRLNLVFERYNVYPNYIVYMVAGRQHCFTCIDPLGTKEGGCAKGNMYLSDTTGVNGGGGGVKLYDWLNFHPVEEGVSTQPTPRSDCNGEVLSPNSWEGTSYCDAQLNYGKEVSAT